MNEIRQGVPMEENNSLVCCVCDTTKTCLNRNYLCSMNCQKLYLLAQGFVVGSVLRSLLGGLCENIIASQSCGNKKSTEYQWSSDKCSQLSEPDSLTTNSVLGTGIYCNYEVDLKRTLSVTPKSAGSVCDEYSNPEYESDISYSVVSEPVDATAHTDTDRVVKSKTTKPFKSKIHPTTKSRDPPDVMCMAPVCNSVDNDPCETPTISEAIHVRAAKIVKPNTHYYLRTKSKQDSCPSHSTKRKTTRFSCAQASLKIKRHPSVQVDSKNEIYDTTPTATDESSSVAVKSSCIKATKHKKIKDSSIDTRSTDTREKQQVKCKQCGVMIGKSYLYSHYRAMHKDNLTDISDSSLSCPDCGKMFMRKQALSAHKIRVHSQEFTYTCTLCGKAFASLFGLSWHKRQVHKLNVRQCGKCGETFENRRDYKKHRRCKHTANSHVCHICGKGFKLKNALQAHLDAHAGVKLHFCEICGDGFVRFSSLCQHRNNLHGPKKSDLPFKCHLCPNTFRLKAWLDKHIIQRHNSGTRQLNDDCEMCQNSVVTSVNCPVHSKETAKDAFPCMQCDKVFAKDTSLRVHMKQHEEPKFACDICHKKFTYKCNMMRHRETHNTEKSFCCHICAKQFCTKFLLASHARMHNQDLLFKCEICGKGLTRRDYLKNHIKKMHPESTISTGFSS